MERERGGATELKETGRERGKSGCGRMDCYMLKGDVARRSREEGISCALSESERDSEESEGDILIGDNEETVHPIHVIDFLHRHFCVGREEDGREGCDRRHLCLSSVEGRDKEDRHRRNT